MKASENPNPAHPAPGGGPLTQEVPSRRRSALALLDALLDWPTLEALAREVYARDRQARGRKGLPLPVMLRALAIGHVWPSSERALAAALADSLDFRLFLGLGQHRPPSASALRAFRHLITGAPAPHGIGTLHDHLTHLIDARIRAAGLAWSPGAIIEPTFRRLPELVPACPRRVPADQDAGPDLN